jgi:hypothetical protein
MVQYERMRPKSGFIGTRFFELYPTCNVVWGDKSWVKFKDKIANGDLLMSAVGSNISIYESCYKAWFAGSLGSSTVIHCPLRLNKCSDLAVLAAPTMSRGHDRSMKWPLT